MGVNCSATVVSRGQTKMLKTFSLRNTDDVNELFMFTLSSQGNV